MDVRPQRSLFADTPTAPARDPGSLPDFDGGTYLRQRDHVRLAKQAQAIWDILADGRWHTLAELRERTGYPEASISARLRDLRKPKFGGWTVEHENTGRGLWRYRVVG
jgi:hypothetical protein